jgi:hypothetical protein
MDRLEIQTDQIRSAAGGLQQTAQALHQDVQAFLAEVQGLTQEPGYDMVSPLIWGAHSAVLEVALECLASNLEDWVDQAGKLGQLANEMDATELTHVSNLQALRGELA